MTVVVGYVPTETGFTAVLEAEREALSRGVDVVIVNVVQVAVVQIIRVVAVLDGDMAATRTMLVIVAFVHLAVFLRHAARPLLVKDRLLILCLLNFTPGKFH